MNLKGGIMQTETLSKETITMEQTLYNEDVEICQNCGNVYKVVWLKEGDDWNDFGYRHCPFCGFLTDEFAHIGKT